MDQFVSIDKIGLITYPTLFVHGEKDSMFSSKYALAMREECPGAVNVEPLIVEGAEHLDFDDHEEYWQRLQKFVKEELEPLPTPCSSSEESDQAISKSVSVSEQNSSFEVQSDG